MGRDSQRVLGLSVGYKSLLSYQRRPTPAVKTEKVTTVLSWRLWSIVTTFLGMLSLDGQEFEVLMTIES